MQKALIQSPTFSTLLGLYQLKEIRMKSRLIHFSLTFTISVFIFFSSTSFLFSQENPPQTAKEKIASVKATADKISAKASNFQWSTESFLTTSGTVLLILLIALIAYLLIGFAYRRFNKVITKEDVIRESDRTLRMRTLSQLGYWLGTVGLIVGTLYMILKECGIDVAPILAGMGILGLAFGFGGQYLIRDIITGIFILFEDQYHINHVVKLNDVAGLVEKITLRVTVLRDLQGRVIFVPNGEIKTVINYTKEWSRALFSIGVAYKENVDHVMEVIKELGAEIRKDKYFGKLILKDMEMLGVDSFDDSQVTIKFMMRTIPIKQWEITREFNRRLKNKFDELGIEIPFPHRTLYWGTGEDNNSMKKYFEDQTHGGKQA